MCGFYKRYSHIIAKIVCFVNFPNFLLVEHKRNHHKNFSSLNVKKCVHYYACLCAFASDAKLADEFAAYVNVEPCFRVPLLNDSGSFYFYFWKYYVLFTCFVRLDSLTITDNQLVSILSNDLVDPSDVCDIEVEVLNDTTLLDASNMSISEVIEANIQVQNLEINANGEVPYSLFYSLEINWIKFKISRWL